MLLFWRCILTAVLQFGFFLAPASPTTSYTQVNHDEPTNAVKETTVTTDQEDLRAPGVGDRDLLWDHVGDLTQHFVLGVEPEEPSTTDNIEETNTTTHMANQIENSVEGANNSQTEYVSRSPSTEIVQRNSSGKEVKEKLSVAPKSVLTTVEPLDRVEEGYETVKRFNRSEVQGKLILYPTDRKVESLGSDSAMGSITKNLRKSLKTNKTTSSSHRPKQIVYDPSDPFSVIFGEVRTEFRTDKSINITTENRENIIGGLAVRKVHDLLKKEDSGKSIFKGKETTTTFKNFEVHNFEEEEENYGSEQEERELTENKEVFQFGKIKSSPNEEVMFPKYDVDPNISRENNDLENIESNKNDKNLFKEWDTVSEEQEKMLEDMVIQSQNHLESSSRDAIPPPGRWFILLLAGNSTIVKLRQKDFAKYLKLNLAARLSLEYDEVKVNRVVLAPPRLMVNVSVVPANEGVNQDLDEELDLEDKIFGEEEAPLHKLAETNATLLELSGEEYHVVRFLSLRSQQPIQMEDSPSATSMIVNDRHMDIELVIYVVVGGTCAIAILVTLFFAIYRYLRTAAINWPWKGAKPRFIAPWSLPRHQRMGEEPTPSIGGPLTVIYSGNFVDRTAPSSGSWIDDCQPPSIPDPLEVPRQQPVYGFGALSNTALPEICDSFSTITHESPRFNLDSKLHILGCRPNHFLLPHQPARANSDHKNTLDVRIQGVGVDNPNYQS